MAWLDCEWVVVSWKIQCTTHLRLILKMLVRNVGFKNVKPSVCTVRELPQPLQSVVDVQACSGIVVRCASFRTCLAFLTGFFKLNVLLTVHRDVSVQ